MSSAAGGEDEEWSISRSMIIYGGDMIFTNRRRVAVCMLVVLVLPAAGRRAPAAVADKE